MKKLLEIILITVAIAPVIEAQEISMSIKDFEILDNTKWVGELMYINYTDGKEVTLKTMLQLEVNKNKITMNTQYADEPEANTKNSIKLKKNGTYLGSEKIIDHQQLENGSIKVLTMYKGYDDNKPATMYKTYLFNGSLFSITKEVAFKDGSKRFIRNRYTYNKIQ